MIIYKKKYVCGVLLFFQRDLIVKKKSLHSVDLLLESARHQLKFLVEKDNLQLDSDSVHKDKNLGNGDTDKTAS